MKGFLVRNHHLIESLEIRNHQAIVHDHHFESNHQIEERDHIEDTLGAYQHEESATYSIHNIQ